MAEHEVEALHNEGDDPIVLNKSFSEGFDVLPNVVGQSLCDAEPDRIGRESQRPVLVEGVMNGHGELVGIAATNQAPAPFGLRLDALMQQTLDGLIPVECLLAFRRWFDLGNLECDHRAPP